MEKSDDYTHDDIVSATVIPSIADANSLSVTSNVEATVAKESLQSKPTIIHQFTATTGDSASTPVYPTLQDKRMSPRPIKHRPTFTEEQIATMEAIFKHRQYLSPLERESVASAVGLTAQQIRVWFQNRRQKAKQFLSLRQHQSESEVALSPAKSKNEIAEGGAQQQVDIHTLLAQAQKTPSQLDPQLLQLLFPKMLSSDTNEQNEQNGVTDPNKEEVVATSSPTSETNPSLGIVASNGTITISPQALLCLTPLLLTPNSTHTGGKEDSSVDKEGSEGTSSISNSLPVNAVQLLQTLSAVSSRLPTGHSSTQSPITGKSGIAPTPLRAQSPVPVEDTLDTGSTPSCSDNTHNTPAAASIISSDILQQILSSDKSKGWTPASSLPPALSLSLTSSAGRSQRKKRQVFSGHQIAEMEKHFEKSPYIDNKEREVLASEIGLMPDQVKVWFQNRRTKKTRLSWRQGREGED